MAEKRQNKLGCDNCPRNNVPGIRKIMGQVVGKKTLIWVQSPGPDENRVGRELVGRAGQWLWNELDRVGIHREDCDIQNVMRCFPADKGFDGWQMRDPTKEELKCCSTYNKQAIEKAKAKVWLVFGKVAAVQLFGKKQRPATFYDNNIRIFILDHPAYFIRGFAPPDRVKHFRSLLRLAAEEVKETGGRFAFLEKLDFKAITTGEQAVKAVKEILSIQKVDNSRVTYDEEDDTVHFVKGKILPFDPERTDGKRVLLCCGVCPKPGMARVFVLDHPENTASTSDKNKVRQALVYLLKHKHEKAMHHGNYDAVKFKEFLGVDIVNFAYDTQYGSYMADSSERSYSLSNLVERKLPKFVGYKDVVQEAVPAGLTVEEGRDIGEFHLSKVPLKKLVLYNGADCHVTKELELASKDKVSLPLVRVYTDAAFIADDMQDFGPLLDYDHWQILSDIYPKKKQSFIDQLRLLVDDPELNPNSPVQMKTVLYEKWALTPVTDPANTEKETLELIQHSQGPHKGVTILQDYRQAKNHLERIDAFKRSADAHNGRVTTFWWLTGTRTGRLSSGGGTRPDKRNLGNLQNIPRVDLIKNMLVSDLRWRGFYKRAVYKAQRRTNSDGKEIWVLPSIKEACQEYRDMDVFVASDYSQQELRILAQHTNCREMIRVFKSGQDVHAAVGSVWTGWSFEDIMNDENKRVLVKELHFGVVYGLTVPGLHQDLLARGVKVSRREVQHYVDTYFAKMREVRDYIEQQPEFAKKHGYVINIFGFKVPITIGAYEAGPHWKNQSINSPIQGAAHQLMLIAIALLKRYPENYPLIRPQMEIHDALVNITKLFQLKETVKSVGQLLEQDGPRTAAEEFGIKWRVPFLAEAKIGFRFGGLVKVKKTFIQAFEAAVVKVIEQDQEIKRLQATYKSIPVPELV